MSHWKMCHVTFGVKYQATIVASDAHTKAFVVCSWNLLLAFKTESEIGESLFTSVIQVFNLQTWPFYKMSVWWLFAQCCSLYLCEYLHRIIILMSHLSGVTQQWFGVRSSLSVLLISKVFPDPDQIFICHPPTVKFKELWWLQPLKDKPPATLTLSGSS